MKNNVTKICQYTGCGKAFEVRPYRAETARFCSNACKGKCMVGNKPWNTGLTAETDVRIAGVVEKLTGKKFSNERISNLSKSHMGQIPWNLNKPMSEDYRKKVIAGTRKAGADPKDIRHSKQWKEQASKASLKKISEGCQVGAQWNKYTLKSGKEVMLRSSTELSFIQLIEGLGITFEYETLRLKYVGVDGKNHIWITDFYLPKYNLIVETKNSDYYKDYNLLKKIKAAQTLGYRVLVVDFQLYHGNPEPSLIQNLIEEGLETIPKGSRIWNYISESEVQSSLIKN